MTAPDPAVQAESVVDRVRALVAPQWRPIPHDCPTDSAVEAYSRGRNDFIDTIRVALRGDDIPKETPVDVMIPISPIEVRCPVCPADQFQSCRPPGNTGFYDGWFHKSRQAAALAALQSGEDELAALMSSYNRPVAPDR